MTDQEILELLFKIDDGYEPIEDERIMLSSIEKLNWQSIKKLPECISLLTGVKELSPPKESLGSFELSVLPKGIFSLQNLESLNLSYTKISTLPESIRNLTSLQSLDLSHTEISELPESIGNLTSLENLNFEDTVISELPASIRNLTNLRRLSLCDTQISELPASIENLTSLRSLDLSFTQISTLPESIGNLTSLQSLNLNCTQISELPESTWNLTNLQYLNLSSTQISELPESMGNLTSLLSLDLYDTWFSELPESIGNLTNLQILDMESAQLIKLPESMGNLMSLQRLNLCLTRLSELPDSIGNLISLQRLNLGNNKISELPESIGNLTNLQSLELSHTQISELPESIGNLTNLQSLELSHTQISELPESIGNLTNLQSFELSHTQISELPESIGNLTSLQILDLETTPIGKLPNSIKNLTSLLSLVLEDTRIRKLPISIGSLTSLQILNLFDTKIRELPESIGDLRKLKLLDIGLCSLNELPESLLSLDLKFREKEGENDRSGINIHGLKLHKQPVSLFLQPRKLIEDYYRQKRIPVNETKIIFLGSEGVGKTHTIKRILNDDHKISESLEETPGISITSKAFSKKEFSYRVNFWDFGGQEIMHSMHRCFLTNRTGYVIVVSTRYGDVTSQAKTWLQNLQSFAKDAPVIIFVNVWNSGTFYGIDESALRREFQNIKEVIHCSAKDSSRNEFVNITSAIQRLAVQNDSIGMHFPETWENVRQDIISYGTQEYYINTETYKEICKRHGVENESIQGWLLDWFNDLGECFTYQSGQDLVSGNLYSMILNPEWLTNAVYLIIRELGEEAEKGVVSHKKIKKLLEKSEKGTLRGVKYSSDECEYILQVMRRHQLSYKIPGKEEEFIPSLLQKCLDNKNSPKGKISCQYEIKYNYLPENVLHRLMVEYYALIEKDECWRDDFSIVVNGIHGIESRAFISADYDKNAIFIQIEQYTDRETWKLLQAIRDKILEINEKLNIHAQDFIVVDSNDENGEQERVSVKRLLKLRERNVENYEAYEKSCNIDALLGKTYGETAVRDIKQKAESKKKHSIDELIGLLGRRDAKNFLNMKIRELLSIDDIYDFTMSACRQIQGRMIFWTRPGHDVTEDTRNDELRDLIASRGLYVRDQSHAGHGEQGNNPGEVDLAILKSATEPSPMTLIEAMNLSGVDSAYILKHLDKLVDGYNDSGIRELFLVSYVELEKGKFPSFWARYKKKIKALNGKKFAVVESEPMVNESLAWIKSMKIPYDYDGEKFFVYHICVRVAE